MNQELGNQQDRFSTAKGHPALFSVAPMMDWTDRHCRYFHRLISPSALLYTEMVTTGALLHGPRERLLLFDPAEHPVALQIGGSDPEELMACARMGAEAGYDEINLNCGCPSDRVQKGRFGACLMAEASLVAECLAAMQEGAGAVPVTVKSRIGIDDLDSDAFLQDFVEKIADKGCKTFIIHARKAWLSGLSPKENRHIPKIDYDRVERVKKSFPGLRIVVNGEIKTLDQARMLLERFDGIMIGREAYQNPWFLAALESEFGKADFQAPPREDIARAMIPYMHRERELRGTPVKSITRHMTALFHDLPGARAWRQGISTLPHEENAAPELIESILPSKSRKPA